MSIPTIKKEPLIKAMPLYSSRQLVNTLCEVNDLIKSGRVNAGMALIETVLNAYTVNWRECVNFSKPAS